MAVEKPSDRQSDISSHSDVVIAGGGLAGLGLAYQLIKARPSLAITVLEKQVFPRPRAIAKVGESTVEIGSHYLEQALDLKAHLGQAQLKKFGIRMFFGAPTQDFSAQDELGASQTFGIPTYQIDRGDLENALHKRLLAASVRFIENAEIHTWEPGNGQQRVTFTRNSKGNGQDKGKGKGVEQQINSRWLLDASGRFSLIKNTLGLAEDNGHRANAIWFRVDKRIEIDNWTENNAWQARCKPQGRRWLSTNHLTGAGYWVWLIPLSSGVTSVGIVMDDTAFQEAGIGCKNTAMDWLRHHQPRCAAALEGAHFLDFVVLPHYSYGCTQFFSDQGWALTGEAGAFTDPFYSPGTDFIAIANNFITQLVVDDVDGKDIRLRAALSEKFFRAIYANTLSLYVDQYGGFGDRKMMSLKLLWDYSYYWGVLSVLFFGEAFASINKMRVVSPLLMEAQALNQKLQNAFCERAKKRQVLANRGIFMDQYQIPCLRHFNQVLQDINTESLANDLQSNMAKIRVIAACVTDMLQQEASSTISPEELALLGRYRDVVLA